jgi:hypothetical protein
MSFLAICIFFSLVLMVPSEDTNFSTSRFCCMLAATFFSQLALCFLCINLRNSPFETKCPSTIPANLTHLFSPPGHLLIPGRSRWRIGVEEMTYGHQFLKDLQLRGEFRSSDHKRLRLSAKPSKTTLSFTEG